MKSSNLKSALRAIGSLAGGVLLVSCLEPADQILESHGEGKLVFVKDPSAGGMNMNRDIAMAANPDEFHPGTDLMLLSPISPTGKLTNLTSQWTRSRDNQSEWGAAQDPEASFDGTRILFSMRKAGPRYDRDHPRFALYEMNADGTNLVQLTYPTGYDDMDPAYIDNDHIVFASTKNQILDEYERRIVPQLFVTERGADGKFSAPRQITFNQSHDQNPFVHSSGKIYYTRWDHLGGPNKMPLFTVDADGTRQFVLYGADETFSGQGNTSGSRTFMEARELRDGGLVASIMERTSDFEGGAICIIDLSKFTSAPKMITPGSSPYTTTQQKSKAIFKTPYPIMDGDKERILVAESAHETGNGVENEVVNYDLFIMDKSGGELHLIHADPNANDYDPVVLAPRSLPVKPFTMNSQVQKALANGVKTGIFFDANVYSRQNDGQARGADLDGKVKYVRVLGAVGTPSGCDFCSQTLGNTEFERQRVIGYGDVREDGSFSIEVPANTPMHVQTLDEDGLMLVNQLQWINVMPGEQRICTGCHGARDKDTDIDHMKIVNDSVKFDLEPLKQYFSGFYNAQNVAAHPSARASILNFHTLRDTSAGAGNGTIQSIFNNRCNSCHGAGEADAKGGGLSLEATLDTAFTNHGTTNVYEKLTEGSRYAAADGKTKLNYANDNGARQSPLAWVMFNRQLGRMNNNNTLFRTLSYDHSGLWEKDPSSGKIKVFAEKNADLLALIEWMDMGTQFMNSVPNKR
ncbi:MAG TPA: hypothetical protein VJ385_01865 [Fibrobacteria bacterium]|nr:hypothetical protein [Fibrobacteria bacterium]